MSEILQNIIYVILTGCGVAVIGYVCKFINKKIDELQESTELKKYTKLNQYIDTAQSVVTTAVTAVAQTFTESLKASGSFDEEAQAEAKEKATSIAKNLITEDVKVAIETVYGDFTLWLDNTIEEVVKTIK